MLSILKVNAIKNNILRLFYFLRPFGRSSSRRHKKSTRKGCFLIGANRETRTPDPLITNQ